MKQITTMDLVRQAERIAEDLRLALLRTKGA